MAPYPGAIETGARYGMNRNTGGIIQGWAHCEQSIGVIVTTLLNTRVMRLDFGSAVPSLIDRPSNSEIIIDWYVAIVTALAQWEPGYRVQTFDITQAGPDGHFTFVLDGIFYPRGHLGDYSISEHRTANVLFLTAL